MCSQYFWLVRLDLLSHVVTSECAIHEVTEEMDEESSLEVFRSTSIKSLDRF